MRHVNFKSKRKKASQPASQMCVAAAVVAVVVLTHNFSTDDKSTEKFDNFIFIFATEKQMFHFFRSYKFSETIMIIIA